MEPRQYLAFLRRRWWLLVLGPLLAMAAAYGVSKQLTPIYKASATLLVVNVNNAGTPAKPDSGGSVIQLNDILTNERLTNTYVQLITRRSVLKGVIDSLSLPMSVETLADKISVSAVDQTQLLRISVDDPSPDRAASIANTTASGFIAENARDLGRPGTVSIAEAATAPLRASKPSIKTNVVVAAVLGVLLATALGLSLDYFDDTIKSAEDIEALDGLKSLGVVSRFRKPRRKPRNREEVLRWIEPVTEDYRDLRTNIHFVNIESKLKSLVITSHSPSEGKSTTAANLAMVLAQAGDRVILVDADLRRPTLHQIIGAPNSFGLTGLLLTDAVDPRVALVQTSVKNLLFLASGPVPPNPSELLTSKRMARVIEALTQQADFVIFDSPPLATVSDAGVLAGDVDGVLLVIEARRTRSRALNQTLHHLAHVRPKIVGAVLNKQKASRKRYGYYAYNQQSIPASGEAHASPALPSS